MSKKVKYAQLFDHFFSDGTNFKNTLPPDQTISISNFSMIKNDDGSLTVTFTDKFNRKREIDLGVSMIKVLEIDTAPTKK